MSPAPLQMYMLLIILLMLSQDAAFAQNIHRITLPVSCRQPVGGRLGSRWWAGSFGPPVAAHRGWQQGSRGAQRRQHGIGGLPPCQPTPAPPCL